MARRNILLFSLLLIATVSVVVAFAEREPDCVYTIYVQTGWLDSADTRSVITVRLLDKAGQYIEIPNLKSWGGLMGAGHDYFAKGNLDIFSGKAKCLPSPFCSLILTSDGTGEWPGWYVNYVDVTAVRVNGQSQHQYFDVEHWLAVDEPPYTLTLERNNCLVSVGESVGKVEPQIQKIV